MSATPTGTPPNLEEAIKRAKNDKNLSDVDAKLLRVLSRYLYTSGQGNAEAAKKARAANLHKTLVLFKLHEHINTDGLSLAMLKDNYGVDENTKVGDAVRTLFAEMSQASVSAFAGDSKMFIIKEKKGKVPEIAYVKTGEPNSTKSTTAEKAKSGKIPLTYHKKEAYSWTGKALDANAKVYDLQVLNENMEPFNGNLLESKPDHQAFFLILKTKKEGGEDTNIHKETWCCNNAILWALNKISIPGTDPIYADKGGNADESNGGGGSN